MWILPKAEPKMTMMAKRQYIQNPYFYLTYLGLTAKLDILEVTGTCAILVEYKRGKVA